MTSIFSSFSGGGGLGTIVTGYGKATIRGKPITQSSNFTINRQLRGSVAVHRRVVVEVVEYLVAQFSPYEVWVRDDA